jgi:hypothetical protein
MTATKSRLDFSYEEIKYQIRVFFKAESLGISTLPFFLGAGDPSAKLKYFLRNCVYFELDTIDRSATL